MKRFAQVGIIALLLVLLSAQAVFAAPQAYLDPNTGGLIFQVLAVVFATLSGFIFMFSSRIKMWFARNKRKRREENEEEPSSELDQNLEN
ncbi:MAG: hypothetical protein GY796_02310 [Chloroflexi bacterium]|nr:hypothetical protein [Chloroflexota bacterium]